MLHNGIQFQDAVGWALQKIVARGFSQIKNFSHHSIAVKYWKMSVKMAYHTATYRFRVGSVNGLLFQWIEK
jgi:hypothetical protein